MQSYKIVRTLNDGKEPQSFSLVRPGGTEEYLLLHFKTRAIFELNGKKLNISPGECIILSPGTPHSIFTDGCELIHDWMHFYPENEEEFLKLKIDINNFFTPTDTGIITTAIRRCVQELIYKDEFYEQIISAKVTELMVNLSRQLCRKDSGSHKDALKALRLDIYRNPMNYPDTVHMANSVMLSRSRFSVVYNNLFGTSPKADLINARISKASYLLTLGTMSIADIAEQCGYQNVYHFIRQFRTVTGVTPGKYRKGI